MRGLSLIVGVGLVFSTISSNSLAGHWEYEGEFRLTKVSSSDCDFVFKEARYFLKFFLMGPTKRTAVIHFRNDEGGGVFHGQSMVGLLGYMDDIRVEKKFAWEGFQLEAVAEGLVNHEVILVQVGVEVFKPESKEALCTAKAEFTGFGFH